MKHLKYILFFLSLVLFAGAFVAEEFLQKRNSGHRQIASETSSSLNQLVTSADSFLDEFSAEITGLNFPDTISLANRVKQIPVDWLSIFIFRNDSLLWWSDNTVSPSASDLKPGFRFYHNGWYEIMTKQAGNFKVAGLLKVKNQYAFQNRFLSNAFHECLHIPPNASISTLPGEKTLAVNKLNGEPRFYLIFDDSSGIPVGHPVIAFIYIIAYLLFLYSVYLILLPKTGSEVKAGMFTVGTIVVTRFLSVFYSFPVSLYELQLFSPSYYASSFILNSLGDLLLTSVLLTYLVSVIYRGLGVNYSLTRLRNTNERRVADNNRLHTKNKNGIKNFAFVGTVVLLFALFYSAFINYLLSGLIINSRISFNINNVFELNVYSLVGVIIIGFLLFSFYLVCDGAARLIQKTGAGIQETVLSFISALGVFSLFLIVFKSQALFTDYGIYTLLITCFLIAYSIFIRTGLGRLNAFTRFLMIILGFSIFAAQTISDFNDKREKENRKLLAAKLENEQDQIAEYLFDDIAASVSTDKVITGYFSNPYENLLYAVASTDIIDKRLTQLYFTGYWGKYDINIKCFNSEGLPVNTGGDPTWNLDHFNAIIREEGQQTYSPYLSFSGNVSGRISYVGKIPIYDPADPSVLTGTIIISMVSKPLQDEAGFPELLLSDKIPQKKDISNYSYAHYRNGVLVNQAGNFNYLLNSEPYMNLYDTSANEQFISIDNFSHLFYNTGDRGLLIISTKCPGLLEFVTLFSYLFSFYAVCFILIYVLLVLLRQKGKFSFNFKNRIQATVVMIVVVTMLLIGGATVYYIFRNYVSNLEVNVNERLKSMLIAIQDELSTRSLDDEDISDEMNYTFSKLAATLAIDFNIYTSKGFLVYSTQPKIYDQSLIARTMNREALYNLVSNNKSLHVQYEEIGTLQFLSAYEPVRNNNNQTIGYINLPYFAKQDELKKDISSFLVALINIYVLLFAFSVFITFIISNRITKPLQLIQQRLGKIKLGKRNELIEWDHDDEIGALVKEYNRMVEELAESAELLARSERESAWREMAKQVAHEIKNPLTPMKLGVQHLERAWKEKSPQIDQIMERFSHTLVEQIDALSNIATEFSNFAKMPKANNEPVNVAAVLRNSVALYAENDSATITLYENKGGNFVVFADKEQLLRVFSNLLKNAIQAIGDRQEGHVHVEIKEQDLQVVVTVRDNGSGIPESEKARIFTPNFTTKTGGMGLGLAMVKNIVELAGGRVWFTSGESEGTIFYVALPVFNI